MRQISKKVLGTMLVAGMIFAPGAAQADERTTLADIAIAASQLPEAEFTILVAAVLAADPAILATLDAKGQRTVFAPTDEAFAALLEELGVTAEALLADTDLVTAVLLYHVAPGRLYADDVLGKTKIRTISKSFIGQDGGVLTDNNGRTSNIVAVDIEADNGIIHVIDRVILP